MGCGCGEILIAPGDSKSSTKARPKKSRRNKKMAKRKKYGSGDHCVFSPKDKKVRCFKKKSSAQNVARGFGTGYKVRSKK
jgi:hypothetical protein